MNFVKRKNKLENCYDSDESDSAEFLDEDEMKSYLGGDMLTPMSSNTNSPYGSLHSDTDTTSSIPGTPVLAKENPYWLSS